MKIKAFICFDINLKRNELDTSAYGLWHSYGKPIPRKLLRRMANALNIDLFFIPMCSHYIKAYIIKITLINH